MPTEVSPNASVKLDGSGNGQVSLGPPSGTTWRLRLANVSTTGTVKQPQAFLYRGSTSGPVEQIDSTFLGNSASSSLVAGAPFFQGQVLWAKWAGGDAGALATLQVYGQQATRGDVNPFDDAAIGTGFPLSVATVFQAGNETVINSAGLFVYSGTPTTGNLIASIAPAGGTDTPGNTYISGVTGYSTTGGQFYAVQSTGQAVTWFTASAYNGAYTKLADINSFITNYNGAPTLQLDVASVLIGSLGDCIWSDNGLGNSGAPQLGLPAGGGPFIAGETFNNISPLPSGLSGTCRVKLLPWNAVWLDIQVTSTNITAQAYTIPALPSAAYYPTSTRFFPLAVNGTPTMTAGNIPRAVMSTSGTWQIILPAFAAQPISAGLSVMYPIN